MTVPATIILPPLFLKDNDLFIPGLLHQGADNLGTVHQGGTNSHVTLCTQHQDIVKSHIITSFTSDAFYPDYVIRLYAVLFPARLDYSEHQSAHFLRSCAPTAPMAINMPNNLSRT